MNAFEPIFSIKKQLFIRDRRGYTIVELVTVVGIIMLISTIVFANYNKGSRQLALELQAYQMTSDIRRVQEMCLSNQPVEGFSDADMGGYGIHFLQNAQSYAIFADTFPLGGNNQYDASDKVLETVDLGHDFFISSVNSGETNIIFIPPDPRTIIRDSSGEISQGSITIARSANELLKKTIIINKAGLVYVE